MGEVNELTKKIKSEANEVENKFKKVKKEVESQLTSDSLLKFVKEKSTNEYKLIIPEALAFLLNGRHTKSDEKSYAFQVFQECKKIYDIKNNLDKISENVIEEFKKCLKEFQKFLKNIIKN